VGFKRGEVMPTNKKQLKRMIKFVAMLKENRYPNCSSFADDLMKEDLYNNINISCTPKTVQRDIRTLKEEFNAPIEYDPERRGYYLLHHGWDFPCPLFEEHEMLASVIGARIAEDILPEPLKSQIRQAVDFQLTTNNPDFLDTAFVKSLKVSSGLKVNIKPDVFLTIFNAWKEHKTVNITYSDISDRQSERELEPHALVFRNSVWFVRGYCLLRNEPRTFAMQRILKAEESDNFFDPDPKIINSIEGDSIFTYDQYKDIEILCSRSIHNFIEERPVHRDQRVKHHKDGTFTLSIPAMARHEAVQFVLYQIGDATALNPPELVAKVAEISAKIADKHRQ
jgi:predicted DNA-binding transcriptional regulator YafY